MVLKKALAFALSALFAASALSATFLTATVVKTNVNLREDASKKSGVVARLAKGEQLIVKKVKGDWYLVSGGSGEGYVRKDMLQLGQTVTVADGEAATLAQTDANGGAGVETLSGGTTDDAAAQTAPAAAQTGSDTTILGDESVPDESSEQETAILGAAEGTTPGTEQTPTADEYSTKETVTALQNALKTLNFYNGESDGEFGAGTASALAAFQYCYGLESDGKYGPVSKSAVEYAAATGGNGACASNMKTVNGVVLCDWFNFMKTTMPKYEIIQVIDVKTGTRFNLRPFACGYHADVEPPTKEDTQTLYAINGNEWSWTPRPILANVKGTWYAAAINVMPHGPDTLPDNGMDGQICMHFANSRQHNTGDENNNMQEAIQYALENGGALITQ